MVLGTILWVIARPTPDAKEQLAHSENCVAATAADRDVCRVHVALIGFTAPSRMTRDEHQLISVTLDPTKSVRAIAGLVPDPTSVSNIELAKGLYGQQMRATLAGQGFEITLLGAGDRPLAISSTVPTQWKWDVTPRQHGRRTLTLTLEPLIATPVGITSRPQTIMTREVDVRLSWRGRIKDMLTWLVAHWVIVLAFCGGVVAIWRWLLRPNDKPIGFQPPTT